MKNYADAVIADLFRYPAWREEICADPEGSIGAEIWRKLSTAEKTVIENIACGAKAGGKMTIADIEAELVTINRTMGHYVTD